MSAAWNVVYATKSNSTEVSQEKLVYSPPPGFEDSLCLWPAVDPTLTGNGKPPFLVAGLLQRGELAITSAPYKDLKSTFARYVALCVVSGRPVLDEHRIDEACAGRNVVIAIAEEHYEGANCALWRLAKRMGLPPEIVARVQFASVRGITMFKKRNGTIEPTNNWGALKRLCEDTQPTLIIFDTLVGIKGEAGESSNDDMHEVLTRIQVLGDQLQATTWVIDHEGHARQSEGGAPQQTGKPRGASDKLGVPVNIISLKTVPDPINRDHYMVTADCVHRYGAESTLRADIFFVGEDGPAYVVGPKSPRCIATLDTTGRELLTAVARGDITSKRKLQEALDIKNDDEFHYKVLPRYESLLVWEKQGKGKGDVPSLSEEGARLWRQLEPPPRAL